MLESENYTAFECEQHQRNHLRIPMIMHVGVSHIRITSVSGWYVSTHSADNERQVKTQTIYPNLSCKTVEIIPLVEIGDVSFVSSRSDTPDFLIRRVVNSSTVSFSSSHRDEIVKVTQRKWGLIIL